jgi:hypothetical protein
MFEILPGANGTIPRPGIAFLMLCVHHIGPVQTAYDQGQRILNKLCSSPKFKRKKRKLEFIEFLE